MCKLRDRAIDKKYEQLKHRMQALLLSERFD